MSEQRATTRFSPSDESATLEIQGRRYPVEVFDRSIGGFCVCSRRSLRCRANDLAYLTLADHSTICTRVIYEKQMGGDYKIGLEYVEDLLKPRRSGLSMTTLFLLVLFLTCVSYYWFAFGT